MKKHYPLAIKTFIVSLILHTLFVLYFPIEWLEKLPFFKENVSPQSFTMRQSIDIELIGDSNGVDILEQLDELTEGEGGEGGKGSQDELLAGVDQEKWGDLLERLEKNTGFKEGFRQTTEDLIDNSPVGSSYINRERNHEDVVIKEVFPTIYNIEQNFVDILKAAPKKLDDYTERNQIIEKYRSQQADSDSQLTLNIQSELDNKSSGPLTFPAEQRKAYFDKTLPVDKNKQLNDFISQYFRYDPNEGDLPIATRELYAENLERLLYTFSTDRTYFYLDFYLENLNKEDFLHNALYQASALDGSKTATELLFAIERIYEIQQRAWRSFFEFETIFKTIPPEKHDRLRVETLRRVNERYKEVLADKGLSNLTDLEKSYRQRRYEIMDYIVHNTPESYRLHDALFERAAILWEMGLQNNDPQSTQKAIEEWQLLINEAKKNNFSEAAYNSDFVNLPHLPLLDVLLSTYQNDLGSSKIVRERQISDLLVQRHSKRFALKREREQRLLWPK